MGTPPTGKKNGGKRHILVDGAGVPLALVVTGANRHEVSQLERLLDSIIIEGPDIVEHLRHLYLDAGYAGEPALEIVVLRGFIPPSGAGDGNRPKRRVTPTSRPAAGYKASHNNCYQQVMLLVSLICYYSICGSRSRGAKNRNCWGAGSGVIFQKKSEALVVEREEEREEIARNLLAEGLALELARKTTGLDIDAIQSLAGELQAAAALF